MKVRFACILIPALMSAAVAAKVPSAQVVDSGSFGVYVNGKRVATETFKVEQGVNGSVVKSEMKAEGGATQRSEMELSPRGDIIHYGWQQLQPTKAEVAVVPKDEFLNETINSGPNEKAYSVPHLLPHSTPIVDDNFFLHREILMWRYLAAGCTSNPEGLSCNRAPQQFGILVPAQHASETVTIEFKAKEKIAFKGRQVDCNLFSIKTEGGEWLLDLDDQQKLIRVVPSASGLEVLRD